MSSEIIKQDVTGYELIRRIGRGAHSTLYLAVESATGRQVAVKTVRFTHGKDRKYLSQISNEFEIGLKLDHPNIVRMYHFDLVRRFLLVRGANLVMEYVDGQNLQVAHDYSVPQLIGFYLQVAQALNYVHSRGYVHNDMKPGNIIIDRRRDAKIIDFGISRPLNTASRRIRGTRQFMAPEQARGRRLDERTDVYNLGATFYYLFRGEYLHKPAADLDPAPPRKDEMTSQRVRIRDVNSAVPEAIEDLIVRSCSPYDEDRPHTMERVIEILEKVIAAT